MIQIRRVLLVLTLAPALAFPASELMLPTNRAATPQPQQPSAELDLPEEGGWNQKPALTFGGTQKQEQGVFQRISQDTQQFVQTHKKKLAVAAVILALALGWHLKNKHDTAEQPGRQPPPPPPPLPGQQPGQPIPGNWLVTPHPTIKGSWTLSFSDTPLPTPPPTQPRPHLITAARLPYLVQPMFRTTQNGTCELRIEFPLTASKTVSGLGKAAFRFGTTALDTLLPMTPVAVQGGAFLAKQGWEMMVKPLLDRYAVRDQRGGAYYIAAPLSDTMAKRILASLTASGAVVGGRVNIVKLAANRDLITLALNDGINGLQPGQRQALGAFASFWKMSTGQEFYLYLVNKGLRQDPAHPTALETAAIETLKKTLDELQKSFQLQTGSFFTVDTVAAELHRNNINQLDVFYALIASYVPGTSVIPPYDVPALTADIGDGTLRFNLNELRAARIDPVLFAKILQEKGIDFAKLATALNAVDLQSNGHTFLLAHLHNHIVRTEFFTLSQLGLQDPPCLVAYFNIEDITTGNVDALNHDDALVNALQKPAGRAALFGEGPLEQEGEEEDPLEAGEVDQETIGNIQKIRHALLAAGLNPDPLRLLLVPAGAGIAGAVGAMGANQAANAAAEAQAAAVKAAAKKFVTEIIKLMKKVEPRFPMLVRLGVKDLPLLFNNLATQGVTQGTIAEKEAAGLMENQADDGLKENIIRALVASGVAAENQLLTEEEDLSPIGQDIIDLIKRLSPPEEEEEE